MNRRTFGLAALIAGAMLAGPVSAQSDRYAEQKVVYHVNGMGGDGDRAYRGAMRNVQNHINAVGQENIDVIVVMHGNGVGMLARALENTDLQGQISSLKGQGVQFRVCNNTLVGREISYEDDLYDVWDTDIVPSGVAELSYLQAQGYTYVKP